MGRFENGGKCSRQTAKNGLCEGTNRPFGGAEPREKQFAEPREHRRKSAGTKNGEADEDGGRNQLGGNQGVGKKREKEVWENGGNSTC